MQIMNVSGLVRAAAATLRNWRIETQNRRAFNAMGSRALSDIGIAPGDLQCTLVGTFVRGHWMSENPIGFSALVPTASNDSGRPSPSLRRLRP